MSTASVGHHGDSRSVSVALGAAGCARRKSSEAEEMIMQARKKLRTGSLVLGFSLWVLLSLGCGGVQIPPASIAGAFYTVYWSPDGSQVVFSRHAQGTFVVDVGGTSLHSIPLDTPIGEAWQPGSASAALSPDGSRVTDSSAAGRRIQGVANVAVVSGRSDYIIALMDADGSNFVSWAATPPLRSKDGEYLRSEEARVGLVKPGMS